VYPVFTGTRYLYIIIVSYKNVRKQPQIIPVFGVGGKIPPITTLRICHSHTHTDIYIWINLRTFAVDNIPVPIFHTTKYYGTICIVPSAGGFHPIPSRREPNRCILFFAKRNAAWHTPRVMSNLRRTADALRTNNCITARPHSPRTHPLVPTCTPTCPSLRPADGSLRCTPGPLSSSI